MEQLYRHYASAVVVNVGRRSGLMFSALDSGSGGPGSRLGRGTALWSWARYFTLIVPLFTQVYKWVLANLQLGVTQRKTSIPSRGGVEILLVASCYGNRDKLKSDGPLGSYADFFTFLLLLTVKLPWVNLKHSRSIKRAKCDHERFVQQTSNISTKN